MERVLVLAELPARAPGFVQSGVRILLRRLLSPLNLSLLPLVFGVPAVSPTK